MDNSHPLSPVPPRGGLRRLCLLVRGLTLLGALLLVAFPVYLVTMPSQALIQLTSWQGLGGMAIEGALRWRALAVMVPFMLLVAGLLWQLWRLFGLLLAGGALTRAAQQRLQRFATAVIALALLSPFAGAALSVALTMDRPPNERHFVLSISSDQYLAALVGLVLLVLARVMADAVRAAEENAGFV